MKKDKCDGKEKVRFEISAEAGAQVYLAGSFNSWTPLELKGNKRNGKYTKILELPKGRHEYKFIVNDEWRPDPNNPQTTVNSLGSLNSIIEVSQPPCDQ